MELLILVYYNISPKTVETTKASAYCFFGQGLSSQLPLPRGMMGAWVVLKA